MSEYVANGNMYGNARVFSNPLSSMAAEPFKVSVNELYNFMLKRCLNRFKKYENADVSLEFTMLRLMQKEMDVTNPLSVILSDDTYYFSDSKVIRRIDKYEGS